MDRWKTDDQNQYSRTRDITFNVPHILLPFQNLHYIHYPQCNWATEWHHWRWFIRLPAASSGATKCFKLHFLLCSSTPQDMLTHFNMQIGWSYPFITYIWKPAHVVIILNFFVLCYSQKLGGISDGSGPGSATDCTGSYCSWMVKMKLIKHDWSNKQVIVWTLL